MLCSKTFPIIYEIICKTLSNENIYSITCVDPVYVTQTTIAVTILHKIHYSIEVPKAKQRIIGVQNIMDSGTKMKIEENDKT